MKYFQIVAEVETSNRWFLGSPKNSQGQVVNPESFRKAQKAIVNSLLMISVRRTGNPLDFTFADFDMPVVGARVVELLNKVAPGAYETFPARIDGYGGDYSVVNFLVARKCLDEKKSEFLKWSETDNRPDKIGQYRQISKLIIDPILVQGVDIFRMDGWRIALIVSDNFKRLFLEEKVTGISFIPVC